MWHHQLRTFCLTCCNDGVEWKTEQRFQVPHARISRLKKSFLFFLNELAYVLIVLLVGTRYTLILFLHCSCQANLNYSWWYGKTLTDFFLLSILLPPFTKSNMQSILFDPSPFMERWLFQRWNLSEPCEVIGEWQVALSIKYQ